MDYRAVIAEAIVVLRRRGGWTAKEFAVRAHMDPGHLSRVELAKIWVTLPVLLRITECLGLSLGEFFRFAEEQAKSRQASSSAPGSYPADRQLRSTQPATVAQPAVPTDDPPRGQGEDEE